MLGARTLLAGSSARRERGRPLAAASLMSDRTPSFGSITLGQPLSSFFIQRFHLTNLRHDCDSWARSAAHTSAGTTSRLTQGAMRNWSPMVVTANKESLQKCTEENAQVYILQ